MQTQPKLCCHLFYNYFGITSLQFLFLIKSLLQKYMAVSIISAQKLFGRLLSINIKSFIITMLLHLYFASLFSLCMYGATYFIAISCFSKNKECFINMNSFLLSVYSIRNKNFDSALIHSNHISIVSTNLFFFQIKSPYLLSVFAYQDGNILTA